MISKEEFKKLIEDYTAQIKRIDKIEEVLDIDMTGSSIIDYGLRLFDKIIDMSFNEAGTETICWWLYEKNYNPELRLTDKDNNVIPVETIDDIWEIIQNDRI